MFRSLQRAVACVFLIVSVYAQQLSNSDKIRSEYQSVTAELQKHVVDAWWIDDGAESPRLLARQWTLAGEWLAAWLEAHPSAAITDITAALRTLSNNKGDPEPACFKLSEGAFLVSAPNSIGNVFILSNADGRYKLAWSTAGVQLAIGKQAEILAAWRPINARQDGRGPYPPASGHAGSVMPRLGLLPRDAKGDPRFYIDGTYAQSAGGTVGGQISLWLWNGKTARPLIARNYSFMLDQKVVTRLEGDVVKVQEKKLFHTFLSCGACEGRQTDWIVRVTPGGVEDLGEKSLVPELDTVDELFYRLIRHQPAGSIASASVISYAQQLIRDAQKKHSRKEWNEFPLLGMIDGWTVQNEKDGKVLCLNIDDTGAILYTMRFGRGKIFISQIRQTEGSCERKP